MVEVKNNKREFNKRARELLENGYRKIRELRNTRTFYKHVYMEPGHEVTLVQGWKNLNSKKKKKGWKIKMKDLEKMREIAED